MREPERGILAEVREAGRKQGRSEMGEWHSMLNERESDDLIYKGRLEAEAEAPSRLLWWLLGVISGVSFVWMGWWFSHGF